MGLLSGMDQVAWDQRPCSSKPTLGQSGRCGPGTTMSGVTGLYHLPPVRGISGTRRMTWVLASAPAHLLTALLQLHGKVFRRREGLLGVALLNALGLSLVKDAKNDE